MTKQTKIAIPNKQIASRGVWYWTDQEGNCHRASLSKKAAQRIIDTMFIVSKAESSKR